MLDGGVEGVFPRMLISWFVVLVSPTPSKACIFGHELCRFYLGLSRIAATHVDLSELKYGHLTRY